MKERGMIFNGEMVRALLAGRKKQTRRIVKQQPDEDGLAKLTDGPWVDTSERTYNFPFGDIGDRIWVRETCQAVELESGLDVVRYAAGGEDVPVKAHPLDAGLWVDLYRYRNGEGKVVPSIHMPRWTSRILLEITGVRVERLNDISEEDAVAEGLERTNFTGFGDEPGMPHFPEPDVYRGTKEHSWTECPSEAFQHLWQSIYGEESWQANPWVWVIEFKRVEGDRSNG